MWLEFHYRIRSMDRDPCSDVKFMFLCKGRWKQQPCVTQHIQGRGRGGQRVYEFL